MITTKPLISEFTAIGELTDISTKSNGRVKYLLLSTNEKEYQIKVAKEQPSNLGQQLQPGCQLKVTGILKHKLHEDKLEYKAFAIKLLTETTTESNSKKQSKSLAKVLICKKSNCWNKGGKASCKLLQEELEQRGIADQVDIKMTGCLKKCKKAPNMIILPDKKHYLKVKPQQISTIVEEHFG